MPHLPGRLSTHVCAPPQFLRAVSEGVVAYLLDVEDLKRPAARCVCRELLAACVFRPLMQARGHGARRAWRAGRAGDLPCFSCVHSLHGDIGPLPHRSPSTPHPAFVRPQWATPYYANKALYAALRERAPTQVKRHTRALWG